ncbi:hypothetical protein [Pseudoneobacillus sp. C159]
MMRETDEKVVELIQSSSSAKMFRLDYLVSDELRHEMVNEVFNDFAKYVWDLYFHETLSVSEEFASDHGVRKEKWQSLISNLFWWRVFYESHQSEKSAFENFIAENAHSLSKTPLYISWLRECEKITPKFYYIGYKYSDKYFIAIDILAEETVEVMVCQPMGSSVEKGGIAFGTLIPLGGGLFFPAVDLYHFDLKAMQDIANHLHYYFDKHLKSSPMGDAFIYVLSAMLQIESVL